MTIEADADIRRKEAAEWFARLNQRKVTTADVRGFSAWRSDPDNAQAFRKVEAMWDAAGTLAGSPQMAELTAEAIRMRDEREKARPSGRLVSLGVAGVAALAICAVGVSWVLQRPLSYETAIGEQRTVQLADGSSVMLDTNSSVAVRFSQGSRSVTLTSGQAMFAVEHDPARPFVVTVGDTRVTALGTRFDVRRSGTGARVILVEGRVAVRRDADHPAEWALDPGQQVVTSGRRPQVMAADVPAATSWTAGRLTFEDTPVSVAVAEVNRYSREPIELRDPTISQVRVSGVFNAGDIDGFVAALTDLYPLDAVRNAEGRIVLSRRG